MIRLRVARWALLVVVLTTPATRAQPSDPDTRPTSVDAASESSRLRATLSRELAKLWTRDPELLVSTIGHANETSGSKVALSFLLAIAHAETNGKVLIVSEAGAVGLAQATPTAYLREGFTGKLFVDHDYVNAARAYIMKKPLGDASGISERLADRCDSQHILRARELLDAALALRREGMSDLSSLVAFAPPDYVEAIEADDSHNADVLLELDALLVDPDITRLRAFSERIEKEYQERKLFQRLAWKRYQKELMQRRDVLIREKFGSDPEPLKRNRAYEVGEMLGRELDARFSPTEMARFLVAHVGTKQREARALNASDAELDAVTAALYNGGSPNLLRMDAGLIRSLRETEQYRKKVPATRRRLDASLRREAATLPLIEKAGAIPAR
ncbi:MAG TPA: hypothetical protein VNM92_03565 [Thermoanaerobaculia bacterium]|nr:hypothetical protein [Thermoanaerobaculia bacterium]